MKKDLAFFAIVLILSVTAIIAGFAEFGTPWQRALIRVDSERIEDFKEIENLITNYYRETNLLPLDLLQNLKVNDPNLLKDPKTKKYYEYKRISDTEYELCTKFSTDTNNPDYEYYDLPSYNRIPPNNSTKYQHTKGHDCIKLSAPSPPKKQADIPEPRLDTGLGSNFENWTDTSSPKGWTVTSGSVTRSTNAYDLNYAVDFDPNEAQNVLTSEPLKPGVNLKYDLTLWYDTESTCTDCFFAGLVFKDDQGQNIKTGVEGCGTYNVFNNSWVTYLNGPTKGYEKFSLSCEIPNNTKTFNVLISIWNASEKTWTVDNLKMVESKITTLLTSSTRACPTELVDGVCKLNNCEYSYPNNIYTKGFVIVGDYYKGIGQPTGTFYDECTSNNKQVAEVVCSGNPNDPYNMSKAVYNCPKGCANGACIE